MNGFFHRNPLPHPFFKWERVASRPGEGVKSVVTEILTKTSMSVRCASDSYARVRALDPDNKYFY